MIELVPITQYKESEIMRIKETDLAPGEIYTAVFTLRAIENYAIQFNAKLEQMNISKTRIGFRIVDLDLHPHGDTSNHYINDGIIDAKEPGTIFHRVGSVTGRAVYWDTGIFKNYESPQLGLALSEQIDSGLVLV